MLAIISHSKNCNSQTALEIMILENGANAIVLLADISKQWNTEISVFSTFLFFINETQKNDT